LAFNNSMASLSDWLFSGKLAQYPRLKLAYSEGQIGWIPYALERADTVWEQHDAWMHSKARIPEPPSTYYYGRIFGCFTADHACLRREDAGGFRRAGRVQGAARERHPDARARPHLTSAPDLRRVWSRV